MRGFLKGDDEVRVGVFAHSSTQVRKARSCNRSSLLQPASGISGKCCTGMG
jgi:hypothetical protein